MTEGPAVHVHSIAPQGTGRADAGQRRFIFDVARIAARPVPEMRQAPGILDRERRRTIGRRRVLGFAAAGGENQRQRNRRGAKIRFQAHARFLCVPSQSGFFEECLQSQSQ
jgi:hypothetical protein